MNRSSSSTTSPLCRTQVRDASLTFAACRADDQWQGPFLTAVERQDHLETKRSDMLQERKVQRKRQLKEKRVVEEELVPKETGRDAKIDKKKALREMKRSGNDSPEYNDRYEHERTKWVRSPFGRVCVLTGSQ